MCFGRSRSGWPDERAAAICARRDEPHLAVGELEHLQRAGEADQLRDVVGDERGGADRDVDGDAARAEQGLVGDQRARADARDARRRAEQRQRDLAREHVDLVAARQRDQHVGVARAGALENVGIRGVADDGAHVEPVLQLAQDVGVAVDDRDFVGLLAREADRRRAADLAGAEDQDLHRADSAIQRRVAARATSRVGFGLARRRALRETRRKTVPGARARTIPVRARSRGETLRRTMPEARRMRHRDGLPACLGSMFDARTRSACVIGEAVYISSRLA